MCLLRGLLWSVGVPLSFIHYLNIEKDSRSRVSTRCILYPLSTKSCTVQCNKWQKGQIKLAYITWSHKHYPSFPALYIYIIHTFRSPLGRQQGKIPAVPMIPAMLPLMVPNGGRSMSALSPVTTNQACRNAIQKNPKGAFCVQYKSIGL